MEPRLKTVYKENVVPELMNKFSYKNIMQVPKLERIVLNIGLGRLSEAGRNTKVIEEAVEELTQIVGQKTSNNKSEKIYCGIQAERRFANRMYGDFTRDNDV